MNIQTMIDYLNKNFNAKITFIEKEDRFYIFTKRSQWFIYKDDGKRFNKYTLFHKNYNIYPQYVKTIPHGWHVQLHSRDLIYCLFYAMTHDLNLKKRINYKTLKEQLHESIC